MKKPKPSRTALGFSADYNNLTREVKLQFFYDATCIEALLTPVHARLLQQRLKLLEEREIE